MMRYFMITMGIIITLTLLLAIFAGSAQADEATPAATDNARQVEETPLICLALVGGTALLAGTVWVGMLRRMPS
jgi:hypothetical protein